MPRRELALKRDRRFVAGSTRHRGEPNRKHADRRRRDTFMAATRRAPPR